jgi:hypothetical protein
VLGSPDSIELMRSSQERRSGGEVLLSSSDMVFMQTPRRAMGEV